MAALSSHPVQSGRGAGHHCTAPHAFFTRRMASHAPVQSAACSHAVQLATLAFGPEVSSAWLQQQFRSNDDADISIIDVRPYESYWAAHIPGAVPIPTSPGAEGPSSEAGSAAAGAGLEAAAARCGEVWGRWRLQMDASAFAAAVESKGVNADKPVVVYDEGSCLAAAWLWWALRVHGHSQVAVLAGGWAGWQARDGGGSTEAGDPCCPLKLQSLFEAEQRLDLVTSPEQLLMEALQVEGGGGSGREQILLLTVQDDRRIPGSVDAAPILDERQQAVEDEAWSALMAALWDMGGCSTRTLALSSIMEPSPEVLLQEEPSGSGAGPGLPQGWGLRPRQQVEDALVGAAAGQQDSGVGDQKGGLVGAAAGQQGSRVGDQKRGLVGQGASGIGAQKGGLAGPGAARIGGQHGGLLALQQARVVLAARGSGGLPAACLAAWALCSIGHRRFSVLNTGAQPSADPSQLIAHAQASAKVAGMGMKMG